MGGIFGTISKKSCVADLFYGTDYNSHLGKPQAIRAVSQAIGSNPLSILIPCHRVVGSNGALTGYAGGIEAKRCLLELENGQEKGTKRARKIINVW